MYYLTNGVRDEIVYPNYRKAKLRIFYSIFILVQFLWKLENQINK